ncbi:MAG: PHP domain-containing protein [Acetivibrionales bacterium]
MIFDMHVHSTFSEDGISGFGEYAELMSKGKIEAIGFTEHVDFLPECGAYDFFNYEQFMSSVSQYKDMGCKFHAGAEIDYSVRVESDILSHLKKKEYEYVIGSVHMIKGLSVSNSTDLLNLESISQMGDILGIYYSEVAASLEVEEFDVIGHVGVYKRYLGNDFFRDNGFSSWIQERDKEIAEMCVHKGKIVEVNSSGLYSPLNSTVPGRIFLERTIIKEEGWLL